MAHPEPRPEPQPDPGDPTPQHQPGPSCPACPDQRTWTEHHCHGCGDDINHTHDCGM